MCSELEFSFVQFMQFGSCEPALKFFYTLNDGDELGYLELEENTSSDGLLIFPVLLSNVP